MQEVPGSIPGFDLEVFTIAWSSGYDVSFTMYMRSEKIASSILAAIIFVDAWLVERFLLSPFYQKGLRFIRFL